MQYFHISCKPQFIISTTSYPSSSSSSPKAHHPACSYLTTICSVQVLIPDFPRQTACIRRSRSRRTTRKYISNVRADKFKQPSCVVHLVECLQSHGAGGILSVWMAVSDKDRVLGGWLAGGARECKATIAQKLFKQIRVNLESLNVCLPGE